MYELDVLKTSFKWKFKWQDEDDAYKKNQLFKVEITFVSEFHCLPFEFYS